LRAFLDLRQHAGKDFQAEIFFIMNNHLPNFLIVGAAKAGTTAIFRYLSLHPDICFSTVKEPCFFAFCDSTIRFSYGRSDFVTDFASYRKLFSHCGNARLRGEASTVYLFYYRATIEGIKKYIQDYRDMKIIILLRNPAERAYSQYLMKRRDLREPLTFEEAIEEEKRREVQGYHFDFSYLKRGLYYEQVKAYLETFRDVHIVLFDDLIKDPTGVTRELIDFLGAEGEVKIDVGHGYNRSGIPKNKLVNRIVFGKTDGEVWLKRHFPRNLKDKVKEIVYRRNLIRTPMNADTRLRLQRFYAEDITNTSRLIGRDLTFWLS
jgi:hypothetical protein